MHLLREVCPGQIIVAILIFLILMYFWEKKEYLTMWKPGFGAKDKYDMLKAFETN